MYKRIVDGSARISEDGLYRYDLVRTWQDGATAMWVTLNPSTADADVDDPTVNAALQFTQKAAGGRFGRMTIVNLFALRATDPAGLRIHPDPVGPDNDAAIAEHRMQADVVILGWGGEGASFPDRVKAVMQLVAGKPLYCLGTTAKRQPRHPQRLPRITPLMPFEVDSPP
jgi:hypothetical protein